MREIKNAEIKVKATTRDLTNALERASLLITADNKAPIRIKMEGNQMIFIGYGRHRNVVISIILEGIIIHFYNGFQRCS